MRIRRVSKWFFVFSNVARDVSVYLGWVFGSLCQLTGYFTRFLIAKTLAINMYYAHVYVYVPPYVD